MTELEAGKLSASKLANLGDKLPSKVLAVVARNAETYAANKPILESAAGMLRTLLKGKRDFARTRAVHGGRHRPDQGRG